MYSSHTRLCDRVTTSWVFSAVRRRQLAVHDDQGDGEPDHHQPQGQHHEGDQGRVPPRPLYRSLEDARRLGSNRFVLQEPLQSSASLSRRIARFRLLAHRLEQDRLQLAWNRGIEPSGRGRLVLGDLSEDVLPVVPSMAGRSVTSS